MMVRGRRSFSNAIDHYFTSCEILDEIRRRVQPGSLLPIRYEAFVADPEDGLRSVCRFLGVETGSAYLAGCASIVRPRPDRSREMVTWTRPWIEEVERRIPRFAFLEGYRYED
jgi:hypothetical protein